MAVNITESKEVKRKGKRASQGTQMWDPVTPQQWGDARYPVSLGPHVAPLCGHPVHSRCHRRPPGGCAFSILCKCVWFSATNLTSKENKIATFLTSIALARLCTPTDQLMFINLHFIHSRAPCENKHLVDEAMLGCAVIEMSVSPKLQFSHDANISCAIDRIGLTRRTAIILGSGAVQ
jgi:hypothetical protein